MEYFRNNVVDIPIQFVEQFVNNYLHRNTQIRSDELFKWFMIINPKYKYDDYLKKLRKIVKEIDLKEATENSSDSLRPGMKGYRKIYLIS